MAMLAEVSRFLPLGVRVWTQHLFAGLCGDIGLDAIAVAIAEPVEINFPVHVVRPFSAVQVRVTVQCHCLASTTASGCLSFAPLALFPFVFATLSCKRSRSFISPDLCSVRGGGVTHL